MAEQIDDRHEVARPDVGTAGLQKGRPFLAVLTVDRPLVQILLNRAFGNLNVEFWQFAADTARRTTTGSRLPCAGSAKSSLPASESADHASGSSIPEQPKLLAAPAQKGRRLDDHQDLTPGARDLRKQQRMHAIGWAQLRPFRLPLEQDQLLTQQHVLGNQIGPAARQVEHGGY